MTMEIKKRAIVVLGILFVMILLFSSYFFVLPDFAGAKGISGAVIFNPVIGLSDEEAVVSFDEGFVLYLLLSIGAGDLHNPPFSSDTPKIKVFVGGDVFSSEILDGRISVGRGNIDGEDIVIKTDVNEIVKMMRDREYIAQSFRSGRSEIEFAASKTRLFSKGYLSIYNGLTGDTIE